MFGYAYNLEHTDTHTGATLVTSKNNHSRLKVLHGKSSPLTSIKEERRRFTSQTQVKQDEKILTHNDLSAFTSLFGHSFCEVENGCP